MMISELLVITVTLLCLVNGSPKSDLDKLQNDFADWLFSVHPFRSTRYDIHKYDDQVEDMSIEAFDNWKENVDRFYQRLKNIPQDMLSEKHQVDYDIFEDYLMTYIKGYEWRYFNALNAINYSEDPDDVRHLVKHIPKNTKGDFENFISRIQKLPKQIQQIQSRLEKAVELGRTSNNESVGRVPAKLVERIKSRPEDYFLYSPFNDTLENIATITDTDKVSLRTRAKEAITMYTDSLKNLKKYMENEYLKHLRKGYGVGSWVDGKEFYKAVLQWQTSLPLTPEEVHQKGLEEVDRISKKMRNIMSKFGYHGTVHDAFDKLKTNSSFFLTTGDAMIAEFERIIHGQIEPKIPMLFDNIPDIPVVVKPMSYDGIRGRYRSGAADGSRPGTFLLNTHHPKEMLRTDYIALALHETSPGHHLQFSIQKVAEIPRFRSSLLMDKSFQVPTMFPFYTAFIEGWALYAESLGEELGLYEDDFDLLGRYHSEIFRACRLVVDTGLHYMNWTKQQAIDYMMEYTARGIHNIQNEISRYITWPGQACAYKIGELKFRELREKATRELGNKFVLKEFHSAVLKNGAMSLTTLDKIVNLWIQNVKQQETKYNINKGYTIHTNTFIFMCMFSLVYVLRH